VPQPLLDLADARASVVCLSQVPASTPFPCAVSVLGLGDAAPPSLLVELELPVAMLHVKHDAGGRFDADARTVTFPVATTPGAPRAFHVELIADPAAGGTTSVLAARLRASGRATAGRDAGVEVSVDGRRQVDVGFAVLPVTPAGLFALMALSVPACLLLVWIARRGRRALARAPRRPGYPPVPRDTVLLPALCCVFCVLALLAATPAIVESIRSLTAFRETRCTVLDRARSGSPSAESDDHRPMAVVRYGTPAGPRVAVGFDVRGTLGRDGTPTLHRAFAVGRDYPCWVDPRRPERVVLRRGVTGVALLAIIPALGLAGLWPGLRRAWRA
jgi:hypothetical protein